jgi:hypothetical protein
VNLCAGRLECRVFCSYAGVVPIVCCFPTRLADVRAAARSPPPAGVAVLQVVDGADDGVGVELRHGEQGAQRVAMRGVLAYIPVIPSRSPRRASDCRTEGADYESTADRPACLRGWADQG